MGMDDSDSQLWIFCVDGICEDEVGVCAVPDLGIVEYGDYGSALFENEWEFDAIASYVFSEQDVGGVGNSSSDGSISKREDGRDAVYLHIIIGWIGNVGVWLDDEV